MTFERVLVGSLCLVIGCDSYEGGIDVEVVSRAPLATMEASPSLVGVESFELIECVSLANRLWRTLMIPEALAHTETTPLRLGTPHVIDLSRSSTEVVVIGTFQPPPGDYCKAAVTFGPVDDDALGIEGHEQIAGQTLLIRDADDSTLMSSARARAEVTLTKDGLAAILELSGGRRMARLTYEVDMPISTTEGATPSARARAILENLATSLTVSID